MGSAHGTPTFECGKATPLQDFCRRTISSLDQYHLMFLARKRPEQSFLLSDGRSQAGADGRPKKLEADQLEFETWLSVNEFREWNVHVPSEVAGGSNRPTHAMPCVKRNRKRKAFGTTSAQLPDIRDDGFEHRQWCDDSP